MRHSRSTFPFHFSLHGPLLLAAAVLLHASDAGAFQYVQDISTANGANGTSPTNAGNGFNNDGRGGDAPNNVQSAGAWYWYDPASYTGTSGPAVQITANGGRGGDGGNAHEGLPFFYQNGGAASNAGNAGLLDLAFYGQLAASNGHPTIYITARGGDGGNGGQSATYGASGTNGLGGLGGNITLAPVGSVLNATPYTGTSLAPAAVMIIASGGNGGGNLDDSSRTSSAHAYGTAGGLGGYGGPGSGGSAITFVTTRDNQVATSIVSNGPGVVALSSGGNGGQGGQAIGAGTGATGGNGGNGGSGAPITIDTLTTSISARGVDRHGTGETVSLDPDHPNVQGASSFVSGAVIAQSLGGNGGLGGEADDATSAHAGSGGSAGMGGMLNVATGGSLTSVGYGAAGIVAQSIGGSGGNGASAGAIFSVKAGGGGAAGDGNLVRVTANSPANAYAVISTNGDDADAIIAQSIGGGGGNGGSVSISSVAGAAVALGGRGETGGNGNQVFVDLGTVDPDSGVVTPGAILSTNGLRSAGVVAQNIGGGGGNGGSAYATAIGSPAALSIGGSGGNGGNAGTPGDGYQWVQVGNRGFIQTAGEHSAGVLAQALGGGGGSGGAAHSLDIGVQVTTAAAVGGTGGTGGVAGGVTVNNEGTIVTMNGDSFGVLAQSVGGGGGQGGSSWAETVNVFNSPDVPSVNMTASIGGNGGTGGNAGAVTVNNSGIVFTQQAGSIGVYAQSVGGGGGTGGMSSAAEIALQSSNVNASVSVGGKGRAGGVGGNVQVTNDEGVVMTFGEHAIGIWAQSIGGGGSYGGAAKTDTASFLSENKGLTVAVAVGGGAGSGNVGGAVNVANNGGSVLTLGDGARGVAAQSVGGGGGYGGGSSAGSSGGTVTVNVGVAGNGGSGGDGGAIGVTNSGSVVTYGGKADGIFAHSIGGGGGGGVGGNAATGGGTDPELRLTDFIQQGLGIGAQTTTLADNIYGFGKDELLGDKAIAAMRDAGKKYLDDNVPSVPEPESADTKWTWSVDVGAAVGGKGGSGGNGNTVTVGNSGTLATIGANSAGIYAQSVGGGGGVGGATTAVNNPQGLAQKNIPVSVTIGVGGAGGSGGHGGDITVTNTGAISTEGAASAGIYAQSVGAGGGDGGGTVSSWMQVHFTEISLGGDGGATGDGGVVKVVANDPAGSITTSGAASAGVLAQSIGGGGGTLTLMEAAPSAQGGSMSSDINWLPQHVNATLIPLRFAGASGSANCGSTGMHAANCGNGNQIDVQVGKITTSGSNSHGVVAQSAGGGGGILLGTIMQNGDLFGAATSTAVVGNANKVSVTVGGGTVGTTGAGAFGVLAQANGGGSLLAGDFSATGLASYSTAVQTRNTHLNGNGGQLAITVNEGSAIQTSGALAHGIVAQSVGGGGALVATADALVMGTAGGAGTSGQIDVTVNGSVTTSGAGASGVVINAEGATASSNAVNLTVGANGRVVSSSATTAVVIRSSAASNTITNNGTIGAPGADAILSTGSGVVNVVNSGWIVGGVEIGRGTFQIVGQTGGWSPGAYNSASVFTNNVEIDLSGSHTFAGDLVNNDLIYSPVNFVNGTGGTATVTGTATMNQGSRIMIEPTALAAKPFTVLTAGTLQLNVTPTVIARNGGQFTYNLSTDNNRLTVTPQANVGNTVQAAAGSEGMVNLARHLDAGFTSKVDGEMAVHYATLARVADGPTLLNAVTALGNESVLAVGTSHLARSHGFVERMGSCPQFDTNEARLRERTCSWARIVGNNTKRSSAVSGAGYKNEDYTVQVGGQIRVAEGWFVGGALSADDSRAHANDGNTSVDGRGFTVGAIVKREVGDWLFSAAVDAGVGDYDSRRNVRLGAVERRALASFDGRHFGVHAQVARQSVFGTWSVKPYMDFHATHLRTDGYTENGAGMLNLRVSDASDTMLAVSPMVEIGRRVDLSNGMKLHAYASAGMTIHDDNRWESDAQLLGIAADAGTFTSVSSAPDRRGLLHLGAKLFTAGKFDFRVEYAGEFARDFRSHSGWVKVNYRY